MIRFYHANQCWMPKCTAKTIDEIRYSVPLFILANEYSMQVYKFTSKFVHFEQFRWIRIVSRKKYFCVSSMKKRGSNNLLAKSIHSITWCKDCLNLFNKSVNFHLKYSTFEMASSNQESKFMKTETIWWTCINCE